MTQSELVLQLYQSLPDRAPKEIDAAIRIILGEIMHALCEGARVEVRGFGSFNLRYRAARKARNPKSGDKVQVPGKSVLYFRAGAPLCQQINLSNEDTLIP